MFDPKLYREACRELTAPEDKIEEVIAMTEHTNKKKLRPLRAALIAVAAVAMMVVGVSAANPGMVEAVAVRFAEIIQVSQYKMELTTEDGSKITVYSAPQPTVENRDGRAILLIDGEEVGDITDELNAVGSYRYEGVIEERRLIVTVEGTAEEWTATVTIEGPDTNVSYSTNYPASYSVDGGSRRSEVGSTFTETVDGEDVYVTIREYAGEEISITPSGK